jgi:hypothetical protein
MAEVIGADGFQPATAAPSSIHGEVRANKSLDRSAGSVFGKLIN